MREVRPEWYLLRNAVHGQDFTEAATMLGKWPDLLDARNGIGETVLHFLAVENDLTGIGWLHARGFSLEVRNKFGTPLLFEVAQLEYRELFVWLIEHGVDLLGRDDAGRSLQDYLVETSHAEMLAFVRDRYPDVFPAVDFPEPAYPKKDHRDHTIGMLELLASEEKQLEYERDVPHVNITGEMLCLWFDDVYHGDRGDYQDAFTPPELEALGAFNAVFDSNKKLLPESRGTVRTWLADPAWRAIMAKAEETLPNLAPKMDMPNQRAVMLRGLESIILLIELYDGSGAGKWQEYPITLPAEFLEDCYRPDRPGFAVWFTEPQLAALADFDLTLRQATTSLAEAPPSEDHPAPPRPWQEILQKARQTAAILRSEQS